MKFFGYFYYYSYYNYPLIVWRTNYNEIEGRMFILEAPENAKKLIGNVFVSYHKHWENSEKFCPITDPNEIKRLGLDKKRLLMGI